MANNPAETEIACPEWAGILLKKKTAPYLTRG
jgi:hypothetical protein